MIKKNIEIHSLSIYETVYRNGDFQVTFQVTFQINFEIEF